MAHLLGDGHLVSSALGKALDLAQQVNCLLLNFFHELRIKLATGFGHAGIHQSAEYTRVDQFLEGMVHRLQEDLPQGLFDAGHAAPVQVGREMGILVPLVVLYLAEVQEDVAFVGDQFHVQAVLAQFLAVADVLQAGDVVAEDAEGVCIVV